jgi:hypothetical protein
MNECGGAEVERRMVRPSQWAQHELRRPGSPRCMSGNFLASRCARRVILDYSKSAHSRTISWLHPRS